ncbi:hypothetical protein LguiB_028681 [Lonicera macranthoides]
MVESGSLSHTIDQVDGKVQSNSKESDASKEEKSFTFEVNPLVVLSEGETGKGWQSFPSVEACKMTTIEGSPSTSGGKKMPSRPTQANEGGSTRGGSKGTPERKPRRSSGKSAGKESARKGNQTKEKTTAKESDRGDKSSVPTNPLGTGQLVQSEELKLYGNVERSGAKSGGVVSIPASNLPDLNTSLPPPAALFQQPFTDVQQVQLRAQIFVYGSLIQGAAPDEACMVSAFGPSDGGRTVWEPKWRAYLERLHGQKSTANNSESPAQPRSELRNAGTPRTTDQAIKHGSSHQSKVLSSPVGRPSSKGSPGGTPSSVVTPMIPLSSPLWNVSTPSCDGLQSSVIQRNPLLDYHQALSPLNPYQAPPVRNFVGHGPSWLSQASFPGPWIASPQTSSFDGGARFSRFPITEAVKLTPVKESSAPSSSSTKHISPVPAHSVGPSVFDVQKVTVSPIQQSAEPKSRKRKKVPVTEDLGTISLPTQNQMESVSTPVVSGHFAKKIAITEDLGHLSLLPLTKQESVSTPVVNTHFSTSVAVTSKSNSGKLPSVVSPTSSTDQAKQDHNAEKKGPTEGVTFGEVEEAKVHAEEAATHAAAAVSNCESVWSQLDKQKNSGLVSDIEAKLASAAVAISAAASVAKAAAAAAKIASNAAIQAKLMVEEALVSSGTVNPTQSNTISLHNTPATILKGGDGSKSASSIILAAREAARKRVEAASAASKHAENLDAIVKAAELAAEAVSQAGKIVAMGDPLPLNELLAFGPEGYRDQFKMNNVEKVPIVSAKQPNEGQLNKEIPTTSHGEPLLVKEISRDLEEGQLMVVDGISGTVTSSEKMDLRGQKGRQVSELAKAIGVVPESEFGSLSTSDIGQDDYDKEIGSSNENSIKQGCLVEVLKDGRKGKAGWFSARVLRLKDEKAFVSYTELKSDKVQLEEWVSLEDKGSRAPRIRIAHPMTSMHSEGTRKRRRVALTDYAWSVGDKVDAWIEDCWCEGVVTEKNPKDETTLTVRFSAQGEKSVKAWDLRPTLVYKDGEWIEWSSSRIDRVSQGDTPKEKRFKLGSPEDKGKDKMLKNNQVEPEKNEESGSLPLSMNEKTFNVGKNSRGDIKLDALGPMRTGFQGSGVNIGVPKPGKKRKFTSVSKHYNSESSTKSNSANDSVKFARLLMPQGSRGSKNTSSKIDTKEKQATELKSKALRSGKPPVVSGRTLPQKDNLLTSVNANISGRTVKNSISNEENEPGQQKSMEFESSSNAEVGEMVFSSKPLPSYAPKRLPSAKARSERMNKGKFLLGGGKPTRVEVKERSVPDVVPDIVEPRRSNRKIQPTSRLLEGLQSSLIISKIPSASHDKSHRSSHNRGTISKGN